MLGLKPRERDKPPIPATVEVKKPDMPKIDEVNEIGPNKPNSKTPSINDRTPNGSGDHKAVDFLAKDNKQTKAEVSIHINGYVLFHISMRLQMVREE